MRLFQGRCPARYVSYASVGGGGGWSIKRAQVLLRARLVRRVESAKEKFTANRDMVVALSE